MKKLVAYITAGYPDSGWTIDLLHSLSPYVDIVELGVPFSDPVADGPVIEKANSLALKRGIKFRDILDIASQSPIETYLMGYFNSFYNQNMETLIPKLSNIGVRGLIIPDLPYEEARIYRPLFEREKMDNIPFIAPTDNRERIGTILKECFSQFIYLVAYAGITGSDKKESLDEVVQNIRDITDRDIFIGFGVNEKTAKEKAKNVDGVIVGSHFVKFLLDETLSNSEKIAKIVESAKVIKDKINE